MCEVKIVDNQIMNFNDRSDYLQGLLDALGGVEYYINDFESIGVLYYDVGDYYNVTIGNNTYKCLMLNREINVTSGIEEIIHTDMPEQGETDYTKADKTDRKINRTNLIVDKQNQVIDGIVTEVDEQNDKIAEIKATTDDIEIQVANMYNATKTVTGIKTVVMEKCIKGFLLKLRIKGNNSVFDRLYPADDLYPSNTLYPRGDSRIIVTDENGNSMMYELRVNEVLRANDEVYDEYILENNFAKVIRRVNPDGTTKINEEVENIGTYTIYVSQGTNTITIKNYSASIEAVFVEQNGYTDQFATKIEMNSAINVSEQSIVSTVNKKLSDDYSTAEEMNSAIEQTAEEINTEVRKKVGNNEVISKINQSAEAVKILANKLGLTANDVIDLIAGNSINLSSKNITIKSNNFNVDENGNMSCSNANVSGKITSNNATITGGNITLNGNSGTRMIRVQKNNSNSTMTYITPNMLGINDNGNTAELGVDSPSLDLTVTGVSMTHVGYEGITTPSVTQTSKESMKKNIELYTDNALNIIKNSEIYKYNFKSEKDTDKKHIGFVIGDEGGIYKTPDEVISSNGEGVDNYIESSILWKAVQEQQEMIEQLQKEIKELKGGN